LSAVLRWSEILLMRRRVRVSGMFVLACVLAVLLGALAVLQYRWVGQLSKDERDRMRAHLRARADDFSDDFNRELTRAFLWLQIGPELRRDAPPEADEQRYERWFTAAQHPELVKTIYQAQMSPRGEITLRQFQRATPRLDPAEWPAELAPIRERLKAQLLEAPPEPPPSQRTGFVARLPLLWPDVPAIIVPHPRVVHGSNGRVVLQFQPGSNMTYTIAVLNVAYMRDQLIPTLVERHFGSDQEGGSLHVAVRGTKNDVVYATADALPAVLKTPDVVEPLWDIRFFEYNRFVAERLDRKQTPADAAGGSTVNAHVDAKTRVDGKTSPDLKTSTAAKASVEANARTGALPPPLLPPPPAGGEALGKRTDPPLLQVMYAREERPHDRDHERDRDRSRLVGDLPIWFVNVQHHAGSLDAAVARARGRNLLVSFGVLLLLATSMTLVLVSSARARRLAAQQMEFVAGVSHELRTPLAVIRSAAENLADGIIDDDKQVRKYGALIAGEGRRLTQMVEQVMTFAGLQAGRPGFDVRPVDVTAVIDQALVAVAPFIHDRGAEITRDLPPVLPLVLADAPAVSRCLENLITNALKYGGDPVRIQITARPPGRGQGELTAGARTKEWHVMAPRRQDVQVTIQDNGPGIAARDLPHIFEPFYRGADAVAKQIHGSGLGLSLVARIMAELGGHVSVRSEPGQGSAFTLHLPIAPEAEAVAQATSPVPVGGGTRRGSQVTG
jgi:signal transduction histidine kinase